MRDKIKSFLESTHKETPIIVIAGPTASGKSSIALELANTFNGYIINADSRQIYKELKIGTAQPKPVTTTKDSAVPGSVWKINGIEHLLYGYISIFEKYSLYNYKQNAEKIFKKYNSDKIPFLVGGTGLYIDSVVFNYELDKEKIDKEKRAELKKKNVKELQKLAGDAVEKLNRSDKHNPHRLIRLIERGGELYQKNKPKDHLYVVIDPDKGNLKDRVIKRVNEMFDRGLVEENRELREMLKKKGVFNYKDYPKAMKSIGYSEFNGFFSGNKGLVQVENEIITRTLQYAKKQRTWFKRHKIC